MSESFRARLAAVEEDILENRYAGLGLRAPLLPSGKDFVLHLPAEFLEIARTQPVADLLRLHTRPVGLPPLLIEQLVVTPGVACDHLREPLHHPQHFLALLFALALAAGRAHRHAQLIHAGEKLRGLLHAMAQAVLAD